MFRRISNIREFGVFDNFSGGGLADFVPFNLIYGWNYSGKTTLSRVFRCLELGALHSDYAAAKFSFTHSDGVARDNSFTTPVIVRVFNEDFKREHLLWDNTDGFTPILLLGAENIEKQQRLHQRRQELERANSLRAASDSEARRLAEIISAAETECASQIVRELPGRLDRRHVTRIAAGWNGTIPAPLSEEDFKSAKAKVTSEEKDALPTLKVNAHPIDEVWKSATLILREQIGSSGTLTRLAEHPKIGAWVERGTHIHRDIERCEFCHGIITLDRREALNAHFSTAFTDLKTRIATLIETLSGAKITVDGSVYGRGQFYADLHAEHAEAGADFGKTKKTFNDSIDHMIGRLREKESNPFEVILPPDTVPALSNVLTSAGRFKALIDVNNERTLSFKAERDTAAERLKEHYAAEAMRRIDLYDLQRKIQDARSDEAESAKAAVTLGEEVLALEAELSEATKGAEEINSALHRFFGKQDIQVKVVEGDRYLLMRGNRPARNLSEGERTAIAFCYFVTKLLESGNELAQTVVYIDDPISSLDSHHLLHINAFLKSIFLKFDANSNPKWSCLAKQVFISTHNYEFFHLCWDWMSSRKPTGFAAAFMTERADENEVFRTRLINCPSSVLKFRSEYLFLYHQLAAYVGSPSNDPAVIFNIGNMARRFVEGYLAFKFFEFSAIDEKLPHLIPDSVDCERARKFMHFYSHSLLRGGGMKLPDMAEAKDVVVSILNGIKNHDPIHFAAMEAAT
ncbi:AAA family ATPase [Agrobacterium sp. ES01]|uniref:AAA family ATPase n=1 Tax=Agrobacterium sp. ES01 TaxID=3420714 RepID=UPI003D0EA611